MRLLIQPGDGVTPLVGAINEARKSVDILIFRFDRREVEIALVKAVSRGVSVRALIAYTNRGGERNLRALEMRLLAAGVTVARTDSDLVRYHGKMMIIDGEQLYLMAFNLTSLDIERSRSFAVITGDREMVHEAIKLFDADSKRLPYLPGTDTFVVSPMNARRVLSGFIAGAKKELLIYDPEVGDPAMARLLDDRSKAEVKVRLLGRLKGKIPAAEVHGLFMRLHSRTIIRDREDVFIGSQSLRTAELDARREIGMIFHNPRIAARLVETFEADWKESHAKHAPPARKLAKKVAKAVAKVLPEDMDVQELEAAVRIAIQDVVAVRRTNTCATALHPCPAGASDAGWCED